MLRAVVIGKTWLEGYRLTFRGSTSFTRAGVANIEPRPGSRVPVGIWRITGAHELRPAKVHRNLLF